MKLLSNVLNFLHFFRLGRKYGFPICCIVHFAWDESFSRVEHEQAKERGCIFYDTGDWNDCYVPCKFHIRRNPNWRAYNENDDIRQLRLFTMEPNL